jgi:hypothetical protein
MPVKVAGRIRCLFTGHAHITVVMSDGTVFLPPCLWRCGVRHPELFITGPKLHDHLPKYGCGPGCQGSLREPEAVPVGVSRRAGRGGLGVT